MPTFKKVTGVPSEYVALRRFAVRPQRTREIPIGERDSRTRNAHALKLFLDSTARGGSWGRELSVTLRGDRLWKKASRDGALLGFRSVFDGVMGLAPLLGCLVDEDARLPESVDIHATKRHVALRVGRPWPFTVAANLNINDRAGIVSVTAAFDRFGRSGLEREMRQFELMDRISEVLQADPYAVLLGFHHVLAIEDQVTPAFLWSSRVEVDMRDVGRCYSHPREGNPIWHFLAEIAFRWKVIAPGNTKASEVQLIELE